MSEISDDIKIFPEGYVFGSYNLKFKNLPKLEINVSKVKYFVEYLKSTGTQYIDTLQRPTTDLIVKIKLVAENGSEFMGAFTTDTQVGYRPFFVNNTFYFDFDGRIFATFSKINSIINVELGNYYIDVDGTRIAGGPMRTTVKESKTLWLFGNHEFPSDTNGCTIAQIYSCGIFKNNVKIMLYPAISDEPGHVGEPCMYDSVSDTCFYNQGTGTFLVGSKINNPIED